MYLVRLVYVSKSQEGLSKEDVDFIHQKSIVNNTKNDLTGFLCFNHKYFLQCLEGSRSRVNEIYHKIAQDPRHQNIQIIEYKEIHQRDFPEWNMGLHINNETKREIFIKYSSSGDFNPYRMSGNSARLFLKELANQELNT